MIIKIRRATAAQWAAANPVLGDGVEGYDSTNKKIKIGDGVTAWALLPFLQVGKTMVEGVAIANGAIAVSTSITLPHGLAQKPDTIQSWIECVTAANGYAVGDRLYNCVLNAPVFSANATNISVSFSSVLPSIIPKAGGAAVVIVAANWKANIRAFKLV